MTDDIPPELLFDLLPRDLLLELSAHLDFDSLNKLSHVDVIGEKYHSIINEWLRSEWYYSWRAEHIYRSNIKQYYFEHMKQDFNTNVLINSKNTLLNSFLNDWKTVSENIIVGLASPAQFLSHESIDVVPVLYLIKKYEQLVDIETKSGEFPDLWIFSAKELIRVLEIYSYGQLGPDEYSYGYNYGIFRMIVELDNNGYEEYAYELFWRNIYKWYHSIYIDKTIHKYPLKNSYQSTVLYHFDDNIDIFNKYLEHFENDVDKLNVYDVGTYEAKIPAFESMFLKECTDIYMQEYYQFFEQIIASGDRQSDGGEYLLRHPIHMLVLKIKDTLTQKGTNDIPWYYIGREMYRITNKEFFSDFWTYDFVELLSLLEQSQHNNLIMGIITNTINHDQKYLPEAIRKYETHILKIDCNVDMKETFVYKCLYKIKKWIE